MCVCVCAADGWGESALLVPKQLTLQWSVFAYLQLTLFASAASRHRHRLATIDAVVEGALMLMLYQLRGDDSIMCHHQTID